MQFTKQELYLIMGACYMTAATLEAQKQGKPQEFRDLAAKASGLITEAEKAAQPCV